MNLIQTVSGAFLSLVCCTCAPSSVDSGGRNAVGASGQDVIKHARGPLEDSGRESRVGVAALLGAALMGHAVVTASNQPGLPARLQPGEYKVEIKSGGYDRVAIVHIPTGYTPDKKLPLVLTFHGAAGDPEIMLKHSGWAAKADKEGFLVVAPVGLPALPRLPADARKNPSLWNSGQLNPRSPRAAIDDVAFIRQLLDDMKRRVPYDENRVYCTGHSNGGAMTFRLATELSERFAAVGTVAGLMAVENPRPKKPLPTLYILGTKDPFMPLAGGEVKGPWGARQNRPVGEMLSKWAEAIGCDKQPKVVAEANEVRKVEYRSKTNGPSLTVLYLEGHGHQWPGGVQPLPESIMGPFRSKLNATDTIWEFLRAHPAAK